VHILRASITTQNFRVSHSVALVSFPTNTVAMFVS